MGAKSFFFLVFNKNKERPKRDTYTHLSVYTFMFSFMLLMRFYTYWC